MVERWESYSSSNRSATAQTIDWMVRPHVSKVDAEVNNGKSENRNNSIAGVHGVTSQVIAEDRGANLGHMVSFSAASSTQAGTRKNSTTAHLPRTDRFLCPGGCLLWAPVSNILESPKIFFPVIIHLGEHVSPCPTRLRLALSRPRSRAPQLSPVLQWPEPVAHRHLDDPHRHQLAGVSPYRVGVDAGSSWLSGPGSHVSARPIRRSLG